MYQSRSRLKGAAGLLLQFSPSLASAAPTWHTVTPPGTQSLRLALSHSAYSDGPRLGLSACLCCSVASLS